MTDSNRRHFTRINFETEYRLSGPDGKQQWSGHVVDLSLHGVLIKQPDDFHCVPGDTLQLELILNADDVSIQMEVLVAHLHDDLAGFECQHIDVESMTHLRRILELNLGDPERVEREISEMFNTTQH